MWRTIKWIAIPIIVIGVACFERMKSASSSSSHAPPGLQAFPNEVIIKRLGETGTERRRSRVELKNGGPDLITVTKITSTCGCAVSAPLKTPILSAGQTTTLVIDLDVPQFGSRDAIITVESLGKEASRLLIPIKLLGHERQLPLVEYSPEQIDLRSISFDDIRIRPFEVVTLESKDSSPWLNRFECANPKISAEIAQIKTSPFGRGEVRRTYRCRIVVDPEIFTENELSAWVVASSSKRSGGHPPKISVRTQKLPLIRAVPSQVFFRRATKPGESMERTIVFVSQSPVEFNLTAPDTDSWLQIEPVRSAGARAKAFKIRLTGMPDDVGTDATVRRDLVFRASGPPEQEIPLPLIIESPIE